MSAILKLVQGTPEWHAHRAQSRNASETPVVLGVSPWLTPHGLWLIRTGRAKQEVTRPMHRGAELEGAARVAYETKTGLIMEPLVLQEGEYSASLDGITLAGDLILEIKCPYKGKASELWQAVEAGELPEHYGWQVETQFMVSAAKRAHVWIFDGTAGLLLEVTPRPERWTTIHEAWDRFMAFIVTDTPPPLMDRDTRHRVDGDWKAAAQSYALAKAAADQAATTLEETKAKLISLSTHPREQGCGVAVTRYWKQGPIDYKKVPALKGADLEQYRSPARQETRITLATE